MYIAINVMNNISAIKLEDGRVPADSSDCHTENSSSVMANNEYRPLNIFDTNVEENRSRSFGINRRALFTFLAICGVVTLVVVVSVVLVVKNGMFLL